MLVKAVFHTQKYSANILLEAMERLIINIVFLRYGENIIIKKDIFGGEMSLPSIQSEVFS